MRIKSNGNKENDLQPKESRLRFDSRQNFFTIRVVSQWNRLLREVVDVPTLELFETRLDGALNLAKSVPAHGRGLRTR